MGCDIHCYSEKRNKETGKWELIPEMIKEIDGDYTDYQTDQVLSNRNYMLFSILADVRNYHLPDYCIISEPKGLPKDVSNEVKEMSDYWDVDGHSHSWHTLKDLLNHSAKFKNERRLLEIFPEDLTEEWYLAQINECIQQANELNIEPENYRIVFWFDN